MRDFFRASIAKGQGRANPLFPAQKMPGWKRWLFVFLAVSLPVSTVGLGVKFLSRPQFIISNIEVNGHACLESALITKQISAELAKPAGLFFTRASKIWFSADRLERLLMNSLPLESVSAEVTGSTLRVTVKEDVIMVIFNSADNWLLVDLEGKFLRSLSSEEISQLDAPATPPALPLNLIPKVVLKETVLPDFTEQIYPSTRLNALGDLDHGLRRLNLTPRRYLLEKSTDTWLSIDVVEKDYIIYVDLEHSVDDQLKTLDSILEQQQELPGMSYLDLRFGNRVYMK